MNNVTIIMDSKSEYYTPVVTPCSVTTFDEEKFLVLTTKSKSKNKWSRCLELTPLAIVCVSILEIAFHVFSTQSLNKLLRFEPRKQHELWRFITYMLVHDDWYHLVLNVVMQCLFAIFLENKQGKWRVGLLYLLAGITGVLGASCVHPDLVIGASAGVYALLISNVADIILDFRNGKMKYKIYKLLCIGVIVLSDIVYNVVHSYSRIEPMISWGAHIVGGSTGFLLGLVLFKRQSNENESIFFNSKFLSGFGLITYACLLISLLILTFQIKKCTPDEIIRIKYIYFC